MYNWFIIKVHLNSLAFVWLTPLWMLTERDKIRHSTSGSRTRTRGRRRTTRLVLLLLLLHRMLCRWIMIIRGSVFSYAIAAPRRPNRSVFAHQPTKRGGLHDGFDGMIEWLIDGLIDWWIDWLMDWLNKQINIPIGGFLWRSRFAAARRIGRRIRSRPRLRRSETRKWRRQLVVVLLLLLQRWTRHRMRVQRQQKRQSHASVRGNRSGGGRTIGFYPNSLKNWDKTVYVKSG